MFLGGSWNMTFLVRTRTKKGSMFIISSSGQARITRTTPHLLRWNEAFPWSPDRGVEPNRNPWRYEGKHMSKGVLADLDTSGYIASRLNFSRTYVQKRFGKALITRGVLVALTKPRPASFSPVLKNMTSDIFKSSKCQITKLIEAGSWNPMGPHCPDPDVPTCHTLVARVDKEFLRHFFGGKKLPNNQTILKWWVNII